MNKVDAIENALKGLSKEDKVRLWNEKCDSHNDPDSHIEYMDSFDDLFCGLKPTEIIDKIDGKNFYTGDDYYTFTGYAYAVSFSYLDDDNSPYDSDEVVDFILENPGNWAVQDLFESGDFLEEFTTYMNENRPGEGNDLVEEEVEEMLDEVCPGWDLLEDSWEALLDECKEYILDNNSYYEE